jgi:hypothetical protein
LAAVEAFVDELTLALLDVADVAAAPDDAEASVALVELAEVAAAAGSVVVADAAAFPMAAAAVPVGALVISRQPVGRLALMLADPAAAKYLSMFGSLSAVSICCLFYAR